MPRKSRTTSQLPSQSFTERRPRFAIDWANAPFPSNRLTLRELRQAVGHDPDNLSVALYNLALLEKEVVFGAYAEADGRDGDTDLGKVLKEEYSKELAPLYKEVGLGSGVHSVKELIRGLQQWAADQPIKGGPTKTRRDVSP